MSFEVVAFVQVCTDIPPESLWSLFERVFGLQDFSLYIDDVKIPKENSIEELQQRQCKELEQMMEWEVNSFIKNWNKKKMEILTFTCNYSTVTSDLPPYGSMERV